MAINPSVHRKKKQCHLFYALHYLFTCSCCFELVVGISLNTDQLLLLLEITENCVLEKKKVKHLSLHSIFTHHGSGDGDVEGKNVRNCYKTVW